MEGGIRPAVSWSAPWPLIVRQLFPTPTPTGTSRAKDGQRLKANEPVIIANEISKRKLSTADWTGAFLGYDGQSKPDTAGTRTHWLLGPLPDRRSDAAVCLATARSRPIRAPSCWRRGATTAATTHCQSATLQRSPTTARTLSPNALSFQAAAPGLRTSVPVVEQPDCAHAKPKRWRNSPNQANAQRIMDAGLLREGDVLIFSKTVNKHGHSTIYRWVAARWRDVPPTPTTNSRTRWRCLDRLDDGRTQSGR